ncbi:hypothetical protein GFC01_06080 [Desulfofundulus thermobenzoicus]|uniref:Uncharacterized protein n=1 Tax=Desulfofundulus thermobenzoicus TaxID=29376 RepID=A0A6N7IRT1_9FIRM|nr:hypothetical protein [Desulfofundulus thermobenzoicus]MQL51838.1 hypothetical protein [Desulfofundulus thermobenzoicus]
MAEAAAVEEKRGGPALPLLLLFASPPFLFTLVAFLFYFGTMLAAPLVVYPPVAGEMFGDYGGTGPGGLPSGPVPSYVPEQIAYKPVDAAGEQAVIAWLAARGSALADEAHMQALDAAGKRWNVDPLLLLAITGQEQSFVPKRYSDWSMVEKNPFNVFGSWIRYHPGFDVSAMWAASTVARLSRNCPPGVSVIQWINGFGADGFRDNPAWGYAGDPNWWVGVSRFYSQLQEIAKGK